MRRRRTIYFNDARHYYLFVFEPPMKLEDAWMPIDEVAGTAVDTFIYGFACGGLFYDSKVGQRAYADLLPFQSAANWRAWENMQSLIDRGLDPLNVLIDRAHYYGMDFFGSMRMGGGYLGMDPAHTIGVSGAWAPGPGGRENQPDFGRAEVRDHQFAVLEEIATKYPVEGLELDFAFTTFYFKPDEVQKNTPLMTDYVRKISEMVRNRPGKPGEVGVRVFPTEEMCLAAGLDVRTWVREGIVDFVVPLLYAYFILDPDTPIDWLVQEAHKADVSVYGMLQPYWRNEEDMREINATPAMMRAVAANYWDYGVDGLYTFFLRWPLGQVERGILTELGDPEVVKEKSKHYVLRRRFEPAAKLGYDATLPFEIPSADPLKRYSIPFYMADDIQGAADRIRNVQLHINVKNLVTADRLAMFLNGRSLAGEACRRSFDRSTNPYWSQWLEFSLEKVRPKKGQNLLELSLEKRPDRLEGKVTVNAVELIVDYGAYPSRLA